MNRKNLTAAQKTITDVTDTFTHWYRANLNTLFCTVQKDTGLFHHPASDSKKLVTCQACLDTQFELVNRPLR